MEPMAKIETPFPEKFGVPRQPMLAIEALGKMKFPKNDFYCEAFRGIELSSHLWLIFEFHLIPNEKFNGLVRPPRFHSKEKLGVYATRTPHRPNRLGLSLVEFHQLEILANEIILTVKGVDLVNGTPILDIKPYVPYVDSVSDAKTPFTRPESFDVKWMCEKVSESELIEKIIALDPRPGHEKESTEEFALTVAGFNVTFKFSVTHFEIISAIRLK